MYATKRLKAAHDELVMAKVEVDLLCAGLPLCAKLGPLPGPAIVTVNRDEDRQ